MVLQGELRIVKIPQKATTGPLNDCQSFFMEILLIKKGLKKQKQKGGWDGIIILEE